MRFATWKSETGRGIFTPRSTELQRLDDAINACNGSDTSLGSLPQRKAVVDALKNWTDAQARKGSSWARSTRNATLDAQGRGTVERLMRELMSDGTFRPLLALLLNAVAAPPPPASNVYVPGKWDRGKDVDGRWYEFIRQQKGNSCVCATIVMVKRAFHSLGASQLSEEQIRGVMALEEAGLLNTGVSALGAQAQALHDWAKLGTGPTHAVNVLRATPYAVPTARHHPANSGQGLLDDLRRCTGTKPGLIGWRWSSGGGHFTMCAGPTKDNSRLVFVDPWTGIGYVDNTLAGYTRYQGGQGKLGDAIVCV
jgi:hypothetical protein